MSIVGYSPWQDAANVGQGIGTAIAKVLFELPAMKRRIQVEEQDLALRQQQADTMEAYRRDQITLGQNRLQADSAYKQGRLDATSEANDIRWNLGMLANQLGQDRVGLGRDRLAETSRFNDARIGDMEATQRNRSTLSDIANRRLELDREQFGARQPLWDAQADLARARAEVAPYNSLVNAAIGDAYLQGEGQAGLKTVMDRLRDMVATPGEQRLGNVMQKLNLQQQLPPVAPPPENVQPIGPIVPNGDETVQPMGLPPSAEHRYRIRRKSDGKMGWSTKPDNGAEFETIGTY